MISMQSFIVRTLKSLINRYYSLLYFSRSLKVHGIPNLRIVDGSVLPEIPTGNINIPIIMVAEKTADKIKAEWLP